MTLNLKLNSKEQMDEFKAYLNELYEYIYLDKEAIPATYEEYDGNEISIYMTDAFFKYSYQFFIDKLLLGLAGTKKEELEKMSKEFRQGSEEFLMSNILLS